MTTTTPIFRSLELQRTDTRYDGLWRELIQGELDLDAPYQRGHVWGVERQRNLIRSLTMGAYTGSICVNLRDIMAPRVVIDGKQRLTAVAAWLSSELEVPAEWFGEEYLVPEHGEMVRYCDLTPTAQRMWRGSATVFVYEARFSGDDAEERERELFDLINHGGLAQGDSDFGG